MAIISERLIIRKLRDNDNQFIYKLVNQKSWLKYIGNRNIKDIEAAQDYIHSIKSNMYKAYSIGLWCVSLKSSKEPIGIAGLIKRDSLDYLDLGFAILDKFAKNGFMYEAGTAIIDYAKIFTNEEKILAVALPNNINAHKLLAKLNFNQAGNIKDHKQKTVLNLFELNIK